MKLVSFSAADGAIRPGALLPNNTVVDLGENKLFPIFGPENQVPLAGKPEKFGKVDGCANKLDRFHRRNSLPRM